MELCTQQHDEFPLSLEPTIPPQPNKAASEYLLSLFDPNDLIAVMTLRDGESPKHRFAKAEKVASDEFMESLRKQNEVGCNIFVCMNPLSAERRIKENITCIRTVYLDIDQNGEVARERISQSALIPKPHFVLQSSPNKFQVVWLVEEMPPAEQESLIHALIHEFGGDPAASDMTRVLRLPSFINHKYESKPIVKLIEANFDCSRCRREDFRVKAAPLKKAEKIPTIIESGKRNDTLASLAGVMRRVGANDNEILAALRETNLRCQPPLSDSEVTAIARSIAKYPAAEEDEPEDDKVSDDIVPAYPMDTIDGDLIGELTRALTDGTFIPPQFMRENIKVALGAIIDGHVGFPNHEDLHTRTYLHNVSPQPQSGKGESYKRSIAQGTGFLFELLKRLGVTVVDGSLFGSREFMVKILKDTPTHRIIARFDEMSTVWEKNRNSGSTLEQGFLTLYESTSLAQGSFKNGSHQGDDFRMSTVGDYTTPSFNASYTGKGSGGSGYLSRGVYQYANKQPWEGDWLLTDNEGARRILSDIDARLAKILNHHGRLIPSETADAKQIRLDFYKTLDTEDPRDTPRLKDHMKRDELFRVLFNRQGFEITAEMAQRSVEWSRNQLENRIALFPEDAGSPTEVMERIIGRTLRAKGRASLRELKRACHVDRAGSGGIETFNRALRALLFGREIKQDGTTRKGMPMYIPLDV